jgi:hypothetical protein
MRRRRYWWLLLLVPLSLGALVVYLPQGEELLLTEPDSWDVRNSIKRVAANPAAILTYDIDPVFYVSGRFRDDGSGRFLNDGSGLLASKQFTAPAWISLCITGDLTRQGNEVYFRLSGKQERYPVLASSEIGYWRRVTMGLPWSWVGKPVELIVRAGPRDQSNAFGISNPRALASGTVLRSHLKALLVLPVFVVALAVFLLPGMPPAVRLAGRGLIAPVMIVPAAVVFGCLAGYLTFWAYFLHRLCGLGVGVAILGVSHVLCIADLRRSRPMRSLILSGEVAFSVALTALVGLFYLALCQSVNLWVQFDHSPRLRFTDFTLSLDNDIPYRFAELLINGGQPRGPLMGEWHYSDRPPLQAGLLLLQMPLAYLTRLPRIWSLVASCALQCAWVPALWSLWRVSGLPRGRAGLALLFSVLTGFTLVNTLFTWPKLLPAALVVIAVNLGLYERGPRGQGLPFVRASLLGLSAALASLGHGGVAFTLLPLGLLLLLPRYFPGWSGIAAAAVVYVAAMVPWSLFQSLYDPPGNLLVRQHLGDRNRPWDEDRSTVRNLIDCYTARSPREIADNKLVNLLTLFRASSKPAPDQYPWPPNGSPAPVPVDAASFRRCEFMCLFWAPGIMNLGWLAAATACWRRQELPGPGWPAALLGLGGALTWVLLMFAPGSTVIHQGSYATVLLLFAALAGWLTTLPGRIPYVVLAVHAAMFTWGWLLTSPANRLGVPNWFMILLTALFIAGLVRLAAGPGESPPVQGVRKL